jgi:hypothetical protein
VTDPGGAPVSKVITFSNFQAAVTTLVSLTDMVIASYQVRTTAAFDKTSDTALANVPSLTITLVAGNNYRFTARLHCTSNSNGGVKATMQFTGTVGYVIMDGVTTFAGNSYQLRTLTLGTAVASVTSAAPSPNVVIMGLISVTVGGSLTVQFAQNASFATKSTVEIGSTLMVERLN